MYITLEKLLSFLETYKGRDKILRLLSYVSKCAAGLTSKKLSLQLDNFSKQLSSCRATNRLLDDIPTLMYAIQYSLGKKEEHTLIRYLNVLGNVIDVIFCPVDHISWAIDHCIIVSKSNKWNTLSTIFWILSLQVNLFISIIKMKIIHRKRKIYESTGKKGTVVSQLTSKQKHLLLGIFKTVADLMFAVNYLPPGVLWSGALSKWQVGAFGSLSSVIALYQTFS